MIRQRRYAGISSVDLLLYVLLNPAVHLACMYVYGCIEALGGIMYM